MESSRVKKYLNKLKKSAKRLLAQVKKKVRRKDPSTLAVIFTIVAASLLAGVLFFKLGSSLFANDIRSSSVMITNRAETSGGTGVIIESTSSLSTILTNAHVCRVVEKGGLVKSQMGNFQVTAYKKAQSADLCLITVASDLGVNTEIARSAPRFYEKSTVSGHPGLHPNVISEGHFSGRRIIDVLTGFRKCTDEDLKKGLGMLCFLLGGIPEVRSYESVLVTATIMPGSSGSGVYNSNQALAGLVFAGSGDFGYAWTVPYEQISNFLKAEARQTPFATPDQSVNLFGEPSEEELTFKQLREACKQPGMNLIKEVKEVCELVERDLLWRK
jgi:hypothetical protein